MKTSELKAIVERPYTVDWWGGKHRCEPKFVSEKLGNGKALLRVYMLNTRPNYYVIRIDDRWHGDSLCDDHIDEIVEAICDEYSEKECEREYLISEMAERGIHEGHPEYNDDLAGNEDRLGWPVVSLDSGYAWEEMEWPTKKQLKLKS